MNYTVFVERYAQKQTMKLDRKIVPVIKNAIAGLAENPRPKGYKNLREKRPIVSGLEITELSTKLMTQKSLSL